MDRFQQLSVFVAVAEEEGFAAAARRMELSPPAVTRAISALESQLGVKLLSRSTRHVHVTEPGERYLEDAQRLLSDLKAADEAVVGANVNPVGSLSVTAPMMFGRLFVVPGVIDYLSRYPETQVSVALLDRVVNLLDEGFDVGVRIGDLPDSNLRALRVGSVRTVVCASPDYLREHGKPKTPEDLRQQSIIAVSASTNPKQWRFFDKGKAQSVRVSTRLSVTNTDAALVSAVAGFGFARLLSYQVSQALAAGTLKLVLEKYEPPASPVQIIHREGRVVSAKIRAFIDLMAERLKNDTSLDA